MTIASALPREEPGYRRGLVLVLIAGVFWSTVGLFVRLIETATAWQILFYRSLGVAVAMLLIIALQNRRSILAVFRESGLTAVFGGLALVAAFCGSIFSYLNTSVANAVFIFASAPFLTALFSRLLLGERVRPGTWLAIFIAALGIGIMVAEGIALGELFGNLAALVSAAGFAFFSIALRRRRGANMFPAVCLGGSFTTVIAAVMCLISGEGLAVSLADGTISVGLGAVVICGGMLLFTVGSKVVPAAELTLLAMTEVLLAPVWVWLLLDESASFYTLLGGAILLSAIVGNALTGLRRKPPPLAT